MKRIKEYLNIKIHVRECNNITDILERSRFIRTLTGAAAVVREQGPDDIVRAKFNLYGFIFLLFWYFLHMYCIYIMFIDDQTIIRSIYDTKLRNYGDVFERIVSMILFTYTFWKVSIDLSGNPWYSQFFVDSDKILKQMGIFTDYNQISIKVMTSVIIEVIIYFIRLVSVISMGMYMPKEIMIQTTLCDSLTLICTTYYYHFLDNIKYVCNNINNLLNAIATSERQSLEFDIRLRACSIASPQIGEHQDHYVCEKIKGLARVHNMLFKGIGVYNDKFGVAQTLSMFLGLSYLILNMFYIMEATAAGLFRDDPTRYMYLIMYVAWRMAYALVTAYLYVYSSEIAIREISKISSGLHNIINNDLSPAISAQAMQLSVQLLHQRPVFTARGLFKVRYELLLEGARTVVTFLVMLLQYAAK